MTLFEHITFYEVAMSLIAVGILHELAIAVLPDSIAGPGGWLIDTGEDEDELFY